MAESAPDTVADLTRSEQLIALAIGNSRSRLGLFTGAELSESSVHATRDADGIAEACVALADKAEGDENPPVVVSTVSPAATDEIERKLGDAGLRVLRFGRDMPIPMMHALDGDGARTVGQDRLLCALGAYETVRQACVVVDVGTAVTIDFVDGEGVFQGGAIAPGVGMMLAVLKERTAALPMIDYGGPDDSVMFGKNTPAAMRLGVTAMVRGSVRYLAERYADFYEAYPRIVATGGDMGILEAEGIVESFVPDLQLIGIRHACRRLLDTDGE